MKVTSQSKNKEIEIPENTPMLLAEETKRVKSFRNAKSIFVNGEYFAEGDLWKFERVKDEGR